MWNPRTDPIPTEAELAEADRRLDELIRHVQQEDDPEAAAAWFIEHLASAFHLPLVVGAVDPVQNFEKLSQATIWALHAAGEYRRGLRTPLTETAREHVEEVLSEIRLWRKEAEERCLLRRWGPPVDPTTQPPTRG